MNYETMKRIFLSSFRKLALANINRLLSIAHFKLVQTQTLGKLEFLANNPVHRNFKFLELVADPDSQRLINLLKNSKSQVQQDVFVVIESDFKVGGFFVEFGATNGLAFSNTFLLETEFSWRGILAEPARIWKKELMANRPNSFIEHLCVWKDSESKLTFNETQEPMLSTIDFFSEKDFHRDNRLNGNKYEVGSISLIDLLIKYNAPKYIDYLSIDTEGSEYEILKAFDFSKFSFGVITIEHNFMPNRELIFDLLSSHGYIRKYEEISEFEDWYVKI